MRARYLRRGDYLVARRIRLRIRDIVVDRSGEEKRLLKNDADLRTQRLLRQIAYVRAVDLDRAARHVVDAHEKIYQRRFSDAGFSDNADHLSRLDVKIDPAENLGRFVVSEGHVLEIDRSAYLHLQRVRAVGNVDLFVDDLEHLRGRGHELHDTPRKRRDPAERSVDHADIRGELRHFAERHRSAEYAVSDIKEKKEFTDPNEKAKPRPHSRPEKLPFQGYIAVLSRRASVAHRLPLLRTVCLDHADTRKDIVKHRIRL